MQLTKVESEAQKLGNLPQVLQQQVTEPELKIISARVCDLPQYHVEIWQISSLMNSMNRDGNISKSIWSQQNTDF